MKASEHPNEYAYWNRPLEKIVKGLPGERLITNDRILVVTKTEGFRGLIRSTMISDFQDLQDPKPGDIYVTRLRIGTLLNVVGRTDAKDSEVVWLSEMVEQGENVSGNNIVRSIMKYRKLGGRKISTGDIFDFAKSELAGRNVCDPKSPIRIVQNADLPLSEREVSYNALGGTAENSVGVASLNETVNGIESIEQARLILAQEADRLEISVEELLDPKRISRNAKKSPLLRKVLRFFE